jgi:hypothetical protein
MKVTKKSVCWFVLSIVTVLSSFSVAALLNEDPGFQQVIPLYTAPFADNPPVEKAKRQDQKKYLMGLSTGAYGKPEESVAKAQLVFKTDIRPMLSEARTFTLKSPVATSTNEWFNEGALYFWRGNKDSRSPNLTLPLDLDNGGMPLKLSDFEEFWIDYSSLPGIPLCMSPQINFQVGIIPYTDYPKVLQDIHVTSNAAPYYLLKPLTTIDAMSADWKEKNYGFLIRRMLGLAPDEDWRYSQQQKNGIMQRRMHLQLNNVEVIDIEVSPGIIVERINLMVDRKDSFGGKELLEFTDLRENISPDGRSSIRLNVREALEKRFAKESAENVKQLAMHHYFLQEIFIFIPGEARSISEKKPLRNLVFLGKASDESAQKSESIVQQSKLASNVVRINANRQRVVIDLRKLTIKGEMSLKNAKLLLLPPPGGSAACAIRIEEIMGVNSFTRKMPTFAHEVENFSQRWGGKFNSTLPRYDQVESVRIFEYLPLSTLTQDVRQYANFSSTITSKLGADNQLQVQTLPAQGRLVPFRILGLNGKEIVPDMTRLISSVGASLSSESGMLRANTEKDLLVLEGQSRALEISWPLKARINDETRFYFGMADGIEKVSSINLILGLADGRVVQRELVPNQSLRLMTGEVELRNVKVRILPTITPYRFELRDMVLFAPAMASYAEVFTLPLPIPYTITPKPVLQATPTMVLDVVQPGRVAGLSSQPLRFSTQLDPALDWVSGVRLKYRLPLNYNADKVCPLSLQFNWVNGKTERQVCFEKADGNLFIPIATLLGVTDRPQNLGSLKSIDWAVRLSSDGDNGVQGSFDLQFSVVGWARISAADHLRLHPLFNAGSYPVFADANYSKKIIIDNSEQKIWLPLEYKAIPLILAANGHIKPAEHRLFSLNQVVAEPRQPMSWDRWRELTEMSTLDTSFRWSKRLMWVVMILLAWVAWRKGWWSYSKAWVIGSGSTVVMKLRARWMLVAWSRWCSFAIQIINIVIGILALGLGLWLVWQHDLSFAGIMRLAASVLIAWGAYCHWREQKEKHCTENNSAMRSRYGILALAQGCAIWSFGHYKLTAEALWGFLPLLGAIYTLLPAFFNLGRLFVLKNRGYVIVAVWFALSLALYAGGLLVKVSSRENYFFIFGAVSLVFMLHAFLLELEPRFRKLFPAVAESVYAGEGNLNFFGALVMLIATAMVSSLRFEPIAEQLAIVAYYCLMIALVQLAWALYKDNKKTVDFSNRE